MAAADYDIEIEQGSGFLKLFDYKDAEGAVIPLIGYAAQLQALTPMGDLVADLTTENGRIVIAEDMGRITLKLTATEVAALKFTTARYRLTLTPLQGEPYRLLQGKLVLV